MLSGFKRTTEDKITRARVASANAISLFKQTLLDLQTANDDLNNIIKSETEAIETHGQNIFEAELNIAENNKIISNIRGLINEC